MRACAWVIATAGLVAACGGSDDGRGTGDSGSSGEADTSSGGTVPGSTSVAATTDPGSTTMPGSTTSVDDTTGAASSGGASSSGGCPVGTEGCACDVGGTCDVGLACRGEVCVAASCDPDMFEPNDDELGSFDLGEINDNDANGDMVAGNLHDLSDVDWFRYHGSDGVTGNVDPARMLTASAGIRLCTFFECDNGLAMTEFECPAGTDYALSTMARPGCCAMGDIALPDLNCAGVTEDSATVYIRLDMPEAACVEYTVAYHY